MNRLETLQAELKAASAEVARLKALEAVCAARTITVRCRKCGATHAIGSLRYIRTHWYVRPWSCTEGDYYKEGEGQYDCAACGRMNRLYDQPEIVARRALFASVVECYCTQDRARTDPRPCDGCRAVGRNRDGRVA